MVNGLHYVQKYTVCVTLKVSLAKDYLAGCSGALRSDNLYEQLHNGTRVFNPRTVENGG